MLPISLPLPHFWNFLLPLPAPDRISRFRVRFPFQSLSSKCFRFRFHRNLIASTAYASTSMLSMKQLIVFSLKKNRQVYFVSYFIRLVLSTGHDMKWNGRRFFHIPYCQFSSIPIPFHTKIFHSTLQLSSIFHSILPYQRNFKLEAMQRIFCCFASLQCCKQPLVKVRQQH